ncbi:hypothetical protein CTAYLR_010407 [Chrysophaeum taylorii]|uniref:DHHA2 domain-containing protein n=1 Tax=Chrysophaeum taylorii TaxID=2483200 RepID=A0AAD7UJI0_9STRA|nr:hypothetical protein CTAYLR_010407 [Chrysophaeum taylorii]
MKKSWLALLPWSPARGMTTAPWREALVRRKEKWLGGEASVIAVGNSGGDLDSIVSAIATAHLVGGVALAAFGSADLALRRDAALLFAHCGIATRADGSIAELAYVDELGPCRGAKKLALVDHNVADERVLGPLAACPVIAVLDHHADEGRYADAPTRVVDPGCGSACSIVAERILDVGDAPDDLIALLLAAIALDTRGFDPKQRKYSERDIRVATAILDRLTGGARFIELRERPLPSSLDLGGAKTVVDLSKALLEARKDVADLDAAQLLRMDYKQAKGGHLEIGCAGVLVDLYELLSRADGRLPEVLREMAAARRVDIMFAMTLASHRDAKTGEPKDRKRKAIVYLPVGNGLLRESRVLEQNLERLPRDLPPDLAELPLFQSQRIVEQGFQAHFADLDNDGLRFSLVPCEVTRKTVLPTLLYFCGQLQ